MPNGFSLDDDKAVINRLRPHPRNANSLPRSHRTSLGATASSTCKTGFDRRHVAAHAQLSKSHRGAARVRRGFDVIPRQFRASRRRDSIGSRHPGLDSARASACVSSSTDSDAHPQLRAGGPNSCAWSRHRGRFCLFSTDVEGLERLSPGRPRPHPQPLRVRPRARATHPARATPNAIAERTTRPNRRIDSRGVERCTSAWPRLVFGRNHAASCSTAAKTVTMVGASRRTGPNAGRIPQRRWQRNLVASLPRTLRTRRANSVP